MDIAPQFRRCLLEQGEDAEFLGFGPRKVKGANPVNDGLGGDGASPQADLANKGWLHAQPVSQVFALDGVDVHDVYEEGGQIHSRSGYPTSWGVARLYLQNEAHRCIVRAPW